MDAGTASNENSASDRNSASITKSKTKGCRKVRFGDTHQTQWTIPLHQYTSQELSQTWYQPLEYETINGKTINLLRKMEAGKANGYCTRGLEKLVGQRRFQLRRVREFASVAVFTSNQTDMVMGDEAGIMIGVYSSVSLHCQQQASLIGAADAKIAERCYGPKYAGTLRASASTQGEVYSEYHNNSPLDSAPSTMRKRDNEIEAGCQFMTAAPANQQHHASFTSARHPPSSSLPSPSPGAKHKEPRVKVASNTLACKETVVARCA